MAMKNSGGKPLGLLLALALAALLLSACAWEPEYAPVAQAELKIGCVYLGEPGDTGWSDSHSQAAQQLLADFGLAESQLLEAWQADQHNISQILGQLAEAGCQIIFCTAPELEPALLAAAAAYPEVRFCCCGGYLALAGELANAHDYFPQLAEARYAAGAAAARVSAQGRLGFIAAYPNSEAISGISAFLLGARSVNPQAVLEVIYTYSLHDAGAEEAAAQELIDRGAEVLANHTLDSGAMGLVAAVNKVAWLGWNGEAVANEAMLADLRCDWSAYMAYALDCLVQGEAIAPDWQGGLAEGFLTLTPLNPALAGPEDQALVDEIAAGLAQGQIQVFAGPLYGRNGQLLLSAGESYQEPCSAPGWNQLPLGVTVLR